MSREISLSTTAKKDAELKVLFLLALDGDKQAYRKFLIDTEAILMRYITSSQLSKKLSDQVKEELIQEVLISIHRARSSYRTDMPITPWIYTIAKYRIVDELRKIQNNVYTESFEDTIHGQDLINQTEYKALLQIEIDEKLSGIPAKHKKIIMMAKMAEFPLQEIADEMAMSLSNVKITIHRLLAKLVKAEKRKVK